MTVSIRQEGPYSHTGLILGDIRNVSSHTTILGGTHITIRFQHGVQSLSKNQAVLLQRELLQALASHGWRPDVSGAAADIEEEP